MKNIIWIVLLALVFAFGQSGFAQNPNAEKGKEQKDVKRGDKMKEDMGKGGAKEEKIQAKDESDQKGKGYGKEKGGMSGKGFGMKRSMEARKRLHQNVAIGEERCLAQENRLASMQDKLAKAKANLEAKKKSGQLKGDALKQKEDRIKMAEEKIKQFESSIIRHIERLDKRKSDAGAVVEE